MYHWVVQGVGIPSVCECLKVPPDAFTVNYISNGGQSEVFFQDRVGVVAYWNHHSGTYWDDRTELKRFIPAAVR
jgi:hypothetical protein